MTDFDLNTEAGVKALLAQTWKEVTAPPEEPETQADPRKAPPVTVSDQVLALEALQEEGMSEQAAIRALALQPGTIAAVKDRVDQKREALQAHADLLQAEAYSNSPEGRQQAASEALATQNERAELAEAARALLVAEGTYAPDDLAGLTADEQIYEAGLDLTPEARAEADDLAQADDPAANEAAAAEGDARTQAPANPTTTNEG